MENGVLCMDDLDGSSGNHTTSSWQSQHIWNEQVEFILSICNISTYFPISGMTYEVLAIIKGAPTATEIKKEFLLLFRIFRFQNLFDCWRNSLSNKTKLFLSSICPVRSTGNSQSMSMPSKLNSLQKSKTDAMKRFRVWLWPATIENIVPPRSPMESITFNLGYCNFINVNRRYLMVKWRIIKW